MIRLEGGARSAYEDGGRPPISALTHEPSIGLIRGPQAAGFTAQIQHLHQRTQRRTCVQAAPSGSPSGPHRVEVNGNWVESGSQVNRREPNPDETCRAPAQEATAARTETSSSPTRLMPKQPPGHRLRKARCFGDEIRRLHAAGYSLESIRETLADAGLVVSWSTVQREAARKVPAPRSRIDAQPLPNLSAPAAQRPIGSPPPPGESPTAPLLVSGKEVAEAFFRAHISNPLLRKDKR